MSQSAIARLYGEQLKYRRFLVSIDERLIFTYVSPTPQTVQAVIEKFTQEFGATPGTIVFTANKIMLSNGDEAKDVAFASDRSPLLITVIPLGVNNANS